MGACFLYGNGGSNRYRVSEVYGGQNPPSTGVKDNDIFLRTNVAIISGEITTNIGGPPTWDSADGVYLITLGTGAFDDTRAGMYIVWDTQKFHNVSGFPGNAYIHENGKWRRCEGYVFHSNKWVQFSSTWNGELFYNGNQYTNVTGGWSGADSYSPNLTATLMSGTITVSTASAVDLSGFSTLKFMGSGNGANSGGSYSAKCKIVNESGVEVASLDFQNNGTYAVSVAALSGKHYVRFVAAGSRGNNLNISKVWLE